MIDYVALRDVLNAEPVDVCPSCGADMDEPYNIAVCNACGADNTDEEES